MDKRIYTRHNAPQPCSVYWSDKENSVRAEGHFLGLRHYHGVLGSQPVGVGGSWVLTQRQLGPSIFQFCCSKRARACASLALDFLPVAPRAICVCACVCVLCMISRASDGGQGAAH